MKKWTQKELEDHIKVNLGEGDSYSYGGAIVCSALYKKLYGELPKIGLSGFEAGAVDEVLKNMPEPEVDRSSNGKEEIIRKIGEHVYNSYNNWTKNPRGVAVKIPVIFGMDHGAGPWVMGVTCDMPNFIESYIEDGQYKTKVWSVDEWLDAGDKNECE